MADDLLIKSAKQARKAVVALARQDLATFNSLVLKDERTNLPITLSKIHEEWADLIRQSKKVLIWSHPGAGKAMPLHTPIPTPDRGFVPLGDLVVGDQVFGEDGEICLVTAKSPVWADKQLYELKFIDGTKAVCDGDHNWAVYNNRERFVKTAAELYETTRHDHCNARSKRWYVPICGPVQYPEKQLAFHPYVLGLWVAAGNKESLRELRIAADADWSVADRVSELTGVSYTRSGPWSALFDAPIIPEALRKRKRIPQEYMQGSVEQRMELLRGVMDLKGVRNSNGRFELSELKNHWLFIDVANLLRSLGRYPRVRTRRSKVTGKYKISVTWRDVPKEIFNLSHKKLWSDRGGAPSTGKEIISIKPIHKEDTICITVDSKDSTFLCGHEYIVTHNTQQLSVGLSLFLLGQNPNRRGAIISSTQGLATKIIRAISNYIEYSPEYAEIFPDVKKDEPWTTTHLTVTRSNKTIKEPSIQAFGVGGSVLGSRLDFLVLDDILNLKNTQTKSQRETLMQYVKTTIFSRLEFDAPIIIIGNAWDPDDMMHEFERQGGWLCRRYPVLDDLGQPTWPEMWPEERIQEVKDRDGPLEFARTMMCVARNDSTSRFKRQWIELCRENGEGYSFIPNLASLLDPSEEKELVESGVGVTPSSVIEKISETDGGRYRVYTGVDLAVGQTEDHDLTCFFTILVHPDHTRQILNIESGRFEAPDIISKLVDIYGRYGGTVIVENNGQQGYLHQWTNRFTAIPIVPYTTGRGKADPTYGIESMAGELASGKWMIPNTNGISHDEVVAWEKDLLYYTPTAHTGDRLMASFFAVVAARREDERYWQSVGAIAGATPGFRVFG